MAAETKTKRTPAKPIDERCTRLLLKMSGAEFRKALDGLFAVDAGKFGDLASIAGASLDDKMKAGKLKETTKTHYVGA